MKQIPQQLQEFPPGYPALSSGNHQPVPYYCEENIWQLCWHEALADMPAKVIFISNPLRQCPIWQMKASHDVLQPVIWDYHVILISLEPLLVWDFDTRLGFPVDFSAYFLASFPSNTPLMYQPFFKIIDRAVYREQFSSDRSHMLQNGQWQEPPPPWPVIGTGKTPNLSTYWDMSSSSDLQIFTLNQLYQYFGYRLQA